MSVLSLERADPGVLVAVCRHLDDVTGPVDRSLLERRFMPGSVNQGPGKGSALTFDQTIAFGQRVGILSSKDGSVHLAQSYRGRWGRDEPETPWRTLGDCLFSEAVAGTDPFASDDAPAADLARLATWFAQLDPTGPLILFRAAGATHPKSLIKQMGGDPDWVPGDQAKWDPFVRWAVALGIARERPTIQSVERSLGAMPDVYRAAKDRLQMGYTGAGKVETLESLLRFLGQAIPFLTTGRLERAWRRLTGTDEDERAIPPPLSFALFRMDHEGMIDLMPAGDGVPYALRFGRYENVPSPFGPRTAEVRRYSNVRVLVNAV